MVGSWTSSSALLLIAIAAIQSVRADTPSGRANHGCALLRSTIYCYGGAERTVAGATTALSSNLFYSLDLSEEKSISDLAGAWQEYTAGNVGSNFYFAMTAVPELNIFVIDGGRGTGQTGYTTQTPTVTFNASGSGSWNTGINPGGHPLVDTHQAVSDNSSTVYLCGGRSSDINANTAGPMQFPTQMTLFNTPQSTWSSTPATLRSVSSQTRLHHKAALGIDGRTIYYVGGIYPSRPMDASGASYYYSHVNMTDILVYDTIQASWSTRTTSGSIIPTPRMDHTLTTKPNTGELIVYGGTQLDSSLPIDDYFYILDPQSMTWSNRTLGTSAAQGAGPRHGHAAVLAGNSTLFIIFGSTGDSDSALSALDIENWSWLSTVPAVVVPESEGDQQGGSPGNGQSQGEQPDSGSSVAPGTIAGAVVGAVAGVAIIGALVFFFLRRRRNQNGETVASSDDDEAVAARRLKALEAEHHSPAPPYSDIEPPSSRQFLPSYDNTAAGKPDGSSSSVSDGQVQRLVMAPVKPDGA
ncbi:hypothetical protein BDA99DRAFT_495459 [Phascolomyces articulosus]|uniref:Galactose oxidase n=1 Tax=Phascolomyces articulosus TaxID=60185 RepID=A0AAD5KM48_9FUNG|nr:hypothetical protein BDA99DRAFT_495459 [Phascolomyces articulosus]